MERYSDWRDAATGIIPFVVPTAPASGTPPIARYALLPFQAAFALLRVTIFILSLCILTVLTEALNIVLAGLPTARDTTVGSLSFALLRFALAVCFGIYRIPEEVVSSTRRGTLASNKSSQKILPPRQGDVIVSNWTSYVDVLYLKAKYNPVFVIPVATANSKECSLSMVSLLQAIQLTGSVPPQMASRTDISELLSKSNRPLVVLAEGTTSNNRALLRFANLKAPSPESKKSRVFCLCIRHDAATQLKTSLACPVPDRSVNPLPHIFLSAMAPLFLPRSLSVKVLSPSEAPVVGSSDFWSRAATAICSLGKFKRTSIGWEEKVGFLEAYRRGSGKPKKRR